MMEESAQLICWNDDNASAAVASKEAELRDTDGETDDDNAEADVKDVDGVEWIEMDGSRCADSWDTAERAESAIVCSCCSTFRSLDVVTSCRTASIKTSGCLSIPCTAHDSSRICIASVSLRSCCAQSASFSAFAARCSTSAAFPLNAFSSADRSPFSFSSCACFACNCDRSSAF